MFISYLFQVFMVWIRMLCSISDEQKFFIYIYIYNIYSQLQVESRSSKLCPSVRPSFRPYHYISCSFYRILSISHTGHHYNVAGVMDETSFFFRVMFRVIFGPLKRPKNLTSLNSFNIAHRTSLQYREHHKRKIFMLGSFLGRFQPFLG